MGIIIVYDNCVAKQNLMKTSKHFHFGDRKANGIFSLKILILVAIAILIDTPPLLFWLLG
jgi:hypothetical protein